MLTKVEAERVAGATQLYRPEWRFEQIMSVLGDMRIRTRALPDVAACFAFLANDPTTRQPTRAFEPGPWWGSEATKPRLPRHSLPTDCHICGRPEHPPIPDDHEYVQRDSIQPASPEAIEDAKKQLHEPSTERTPA